MRNRIIACVVALLALIPSLHAADLDVSGLDTPRDKTVAAKRLLEWVKSLGYKAELSEDGEDVFVRDTKLVLSPVLSADTIDKIVVYNFYRGEPGNKNNAELAAILAKINASTNAAHIFVDSDDVITFVSVITFDDTLTPRMLKLFMDYTNKAAAYTIKAYPELAKYIK